MLWGALLFSDAEKEGLTIFKLTMNSSRIFSPAESWLVAYIKHHLYKKKKNPVRERQRNEGTQTVIVHDLCCWRNRCSAERWPTTNGMSVRECVCVRGKGEWGVLSCVVMKEKTNILHHVPHHTFPHWLGLFKSCCQPSLSALLSLRLGLWELLSTVWRRQTASLLRTEFFRGN